MLTAWIQLVVVLFTMLSEALAGRETVLGKQDLTIAKFQDYNCDQNKSSEVSTQRYFRYLQPSMKNSSQLYVGAMNYLYKLDIENLRCVKHKEYKANADDLRRCVIQGKKENPDCQNHIRVVMEIYDQLLICGTGGYSPKKYSLDSSWLSLNVSGDMESGIAFCPYDPFDNYTALVVTEGNPGNATVPYFGTYTDFIKNSPVFYRPRFNSKAGNESFLEKTTDREDYKWLNYPQFVGSFDNNDSVLFFFREVALEYMMKENKIFSRVGKVCKQDVGGGYMEVSKKKWLSFQKARLVCSLPGQSPYYFDDIYDVFESGDRFYAVFYKQGADLGTSAICVYNKQDILNVFKGKFKRRTSFGVWETVPDVENPNPRLDNCDWLEKNRNSLEDKSPSYQLMDANVDPQYGRPIFYKSGIQINNIVVTETKKSDSGNAVNIYASTTEGEVYDIFFKEFSSGSTFLSELNLVYRPFGEPASRNVVWDMKIMSNKLYFGTDYEVSSLNLMAVCQNIEYINVCIRNTHCKWRICDSQCVDSGKSNCTEPGKMTDWTRITKDGVLHSIQDLVRANETTLDLIKGFYATVTFERKYKPEEVTWTKEVSNNSIMKRSTSTNTCENKQDVLEGSDKFAVTSNGDLIIKNLTSDDAGVYMACDKKDMSLPLTIVKVIPTDDKNENIVDVWKQQFNEWATAFKKWKVCADDYLDSCPANTG